MSAEQFDKLFEGYRFIAVHSETDEVWVGAEDDIQLSEAMETTEQPYQLESGPYKLGGVDLNTA